MAVIALAPEGLWFTELPISDLSQFQPGICRLMTAEREPHVLGIAARRSGVELGHTLT